MFLFKKKIVIKTSPHPPLLKSFQALLTDEEDADSLTDLFTDIHILCAGPGFPG